MNAYSQKISPVSSGGLNVLKTGGQPSLLNRLGEYWKIAGLVIFAIILIVGFSTTRQLTVQVANLGGGQNFIEFFMEYIRDLASTQIHGSDSRRWVPYLATLFLFIFVSNWSGALVPWRIFEIPNGELGAPTNDINTTEIGRAHV